MGVGKGKGTGLCHNVFWLCEAIYPRNQHFQIHISKRIIKSYEEKNPLLKQAYVHFGMDQSYTLRTNGQIVHKCDCGASLLKEHN